MRRAGGAFVAKLAVAAPAAALAASLFPASATAVFVLLAYATLSAGLTCAAKACLTPAAAADVSPEEQQLRRALLIAHKGIGLAAAIGLGIAVPASFAYYLAAGMGLGLHLGIKIEDVDHPPPPAPLKRLNPLRMIRDHFNSPEMSRKRAARFLKREGISYTTIGGDLYVRDLDLSNRNLKKLPDLSHVRVCAAFNCAHNRLTSLKGAPMDAGDFDCSSNLLSTLEHAPRRAVAFNCAANKLTSLKGAPGNIERDFICDDNQLETLDGGPALVNGNFSCRGNPLAFLAHAPALVKGELLCPPELYQPLTARAAAMQEEADFLAGQTVLRQPLRAARTLRFRR